MNSNRQLLLTLLLAAPLAGCDGCKDSGETGCTSTVDADGDGWTLCDDCDDADPAVHPDATDCVNGLDDDCDGEEDPAGAPEPGTWHPDSDGDGFGDYASTVQACDQPDDAVDDATDCDDGEAEVHPEADEYCNERDDDCDGLVDEDAVDAVTWTTDDDGDGWGVEGTEQTSCEQPDGTADQAGDCADDDPDAHPEAEPGCDGRDLDCDGAIDNDMDLDGFSDEVCGGQDCDDGDDTVYPDAEEICGDGVVNDCGSTTADANAACYEDLYLEDSLAIIDGGENRARAGYSVAGGADVNADGWPDVAVGAPGWNADDQDSSVGFVGLFYGPLSGNYAVTDADVSVRGEVGGNPVDWAGECVSFPGDVNLDGHEDLLLGSGDVGGVGSGAAHLFYGPLSGAMTISDADALLTGAPWGGDVGEALAGAGDVNGDGYPDLIVGDDQQGAYPPQGQAYLVHGPVSGVGSLVGADAVFTGASQGDYAGCAVASAGDVNGDGLDDLLVGAHGEGRGAAYLVLSPVVGELSLADADASLVGENGGDRAGTSVEGAGDLDDDGLADFLVGAPQVFGSPGRAYAVLGLPSGELGLSSAEISIVGAEDDDETGSAVSCAGDVDGDGSLDLLIGAQEMRWLSDTPGGAYVVLAPEPGTYDLAAPDIRMIGYSDVDDISDAGVAVAGAGDMDGDGRDDVLVGAPSTETSATMAGTAYLVSIPMTY
jgi:hypothetical protein